jgi:hypothetical protein
VVAVTQVRNPDKGIFGGLGVFGLVFVAVIFAVVVSIIQSVFDLVDLIKIKVKE